MSNLNTPELLLNALIAYPELAVLLGAAPDNRDDWLDFVFTSTDKMRKFYCYDSILTSVMEVCGVNNFGIFRTVKDKIEYPSLIKISYLDFHAVVVALDKKRIYCIDVNTSERSHDIRFARDGHLFYKMTEVALNQWIAKLQIGQDLEKFFGGYLPEGTIVTVEQAPIGTYFPVDAVMDQCLTRLIGYIYLKPQAINNAIPTRSIPEQEYHDFSQIDDDGIRQLFQTFSSEESTVKEPSYTKSHKTVDLLQKYLHFTIETKFKMLKTKMQSLQLKALPTLGGDEEY